jgi:dephospho-CoA kinase
MLFVGLTGGIGSGKSEALAACERLGAAVLSSDAVVHELLASDEVRERLVARWGDRVLGSNGAIDRDRVAEIVFGRPEELGWLEGELFPRVAARTAAWRAELERAGGAEVAVVEVPLLFEADLAAAFDATIAVVASEEARARRVGDRDHRGLNGRDARQLPPQEKARRSDFVIENDGSLEDLEQRVADVLEQLKQKARQ